MGTTSGLACKHTISPMVAFSLRCWTMLQQRSIYNAYLVELLFRLQQLRAESPQPSPATTALSLGFDGSFQIIKVKHHLATIGRRSWRSKTTRKPASPFFVFLRKKSIAHGNHRCWLYILNLKKNVQYILDDFIIIYYCYYYYYCCYYYYYYHYHYCILLRNTANPISRIDWDMPFNDDFLQYDINKNWTNECPKALRASLQTIIWANYNNSLTWIKAIWGWFPLLTMISSELVVSSL